MRIAIPIAQFHRGNTGEYVERAFWKLGHEAVILTGPEFYSALAAESYDLYFCVDSGQPIDLTHLDIPLDRVCYWFIDYRHHKQSIEWNPPDAANAKALSDGGGWVFQSQFEDVDDAKARGIDRCSWLPLAADPEVWSDAPKEEKLFDIGFAGNVWDRGRAAALDAMLRAPNLKVGFKGHGAAWKEDGAKLLRASKIGFNISSWYGTEHAFDVNMRVFETLSCGVPLLTNSVPALQRVFPEGAPFIREFKSLEELLPMVHAALNDQHFLNSGGLARQWVLEHATYALRMRSALFELGLS